MNLYVAAAWLERAEARKVMGQLIASGHRITYDWTRADQFNILQAAKDKQAVLDADALVFLAEKEYSSTGGALVEMGMAIGLGKPVFIIGPGINKNIFTLLPQVHRSIDSLLKPHSLCYT
jgi:nucleoside 2-deoxyribosyltransferase